MLKTLLLLLMLLILFALVKFYQVSYKTESCPRPGELATTRTILVHSPKQEQLITSQTEIQFEKDELRRYYQFNKLEGSEILIKTRSQWVSEQWETEVFELIEKNKILNLHQNDWILWSTANFGTTELVFNFIASLLLTNYKKFLIFCFDKNIYNSLVSYGFQNNAVMVPKRWCNNETITEKREEFGRGKLDYNAILRCRWAISMKLLEKNMSFIQSDVDVVFVKPFVLEQALYNIGMGCENCLRRKPWLGDMVVLTEPRSTRACQGFYAVRPTDFIKTLFTETWEILKQNPEAIDQEVFQYRVSYYNAKSSDYRKKIIYLDRFTYASGYFYHFKNNAYQWNIEPLLVHMNWQQAKFKIPSFKKAKLWYIGEQFADYTKEN